MNSSSFGDNESVLFSETGEMVHDFSNRRFISLVERERNVKDQSFGRFLFGIGKLELFYIGNFAVFKQFFVFA